MTKKDARRALSLIEDLRQILRKTDTINNQIAPFMPIWYALDSTKRIIERECEAHINRSISQEL